MGKYFGAVIGYSGAATPKLLQREMNTINRDSYKETGEWYHTKFFMDRFTYSGGKQLKFQERTRAYTARKWRLHGHRHFLKFSGRSEQAARIRDVRATASSKRIEARIMIHARALNFRSNANAPDMREEVGRVARRHVKPTTDYLASRIEGRFGAVKSETNERV